MCNDEPVARERNGNLCHVKYIISLPSPQPMASKQIPDESRIAYSCRSYHFVTWQEALDII